MASPAKIRELRVRPVATFNSNFTNGGASTWNVIDSNAYKLRVQEYDDSGLTREGIPDETLQTRMYAKPDPVPGLSKGKLKFSFFAGSASGANVNTAPTEAIIVNAFLGGILECMNYRRAVAGVNNDVNCINVGHGSANSFALNGHAVLVGKKGDGRGNGEVKPVVRSNTTHIVLGIACNAAPAAGDLLSVSTTTFIDETATQEYLDTYALGHATADHRQTIGGMGAIKLKDAGTGGLPKWEVDLAVADHRWCDTNSRSTMAHSNAPLGADPPFSKAIGMIQIGDFGSNTRAVYKGGDIAFDPGIAYEEIPGAHGVNGMAGHQKVPGVPVAELTLLTDEDMPGLDDDFIAGTAKTIIMQFGHEAGRCMAVELPKAYLDAAPSSAALNNLHAVKLKFHGTEDYNSGSAVLSSAVRIHMF